MVYMDKTVRGHVHRTARTLPVTERMEPVTLVALTVSMVITVRIVSIKYTHNFFAVSIVLRNEKFIKFYIRTSIAQIRPECYKTLSCSTQLSIKFQLFM